MVCDQTDGYVIIIILLVFFSGDLTYQVTQCADSIYIEDGIYVLHNNCQTFQTHTCINVLLFQCCIISVTIVLKLGKYVVPYFHVTVTVTSYCTARFSATILLSTVIIDL